MVYRINDEWIMINVWINYEWINECKDKGWINEYQDECWINKWMVYRINHNRINEWYIWWIVNR